MTPTLLFVCFVLYVVRMFAVTAGYHRYFSHRAFKTSRLAQFLLAVAAQTSAHRGIVWWAAKHRAHHKYSDTPQDPHSPRQRGFLFAHLSWIFVPNTSEADYTFVPDLVRYPELMWLDQHKYLPAIILGVMVWLLGGWTGLVAFFISTVILWHCTFAINSLAHVVGKKRYVTGDDSRNNWWLALITLGEGWHNNHHHFQSSTRQGFFWWEVDITFYVLRFLAMLRIVWDLQYPTAAIVRGTQRLSRTVVETVANQLAWSFPIEKISQQLRDTWVHTPSCFEDIRKRVRAARWQAEALLAEASLPQIPSLDELKQRAREMFVHTPRLDDIADRAREILLQALLARLFDEPLQLAPNKIID
ncbi:MAG: acyl-CoA desaturase [bacterium]|nr:acyl-CoA desaturase [bacterium]